MDLKNELERGYKTFKAFEHGLELVEKLMGIEQKVKEAEKKLKTLQESVEKGKQATDLTLANLEKQKLQVKESLEAEILKAQADSASLKAKLDETLANETLKAKEAAKKKKDEFEAEAEAVRNETQLLVGRKLALEAELVNLESKKATASKVVETLGLEADALTQKVNTQKQLLKNLAESL